MIGTISLRIARAALTGVAVVTVSVVPARAQLIIPGFAVFPGGQEAITAYGSLVTQNPSLMSSSAYVTAGGAIMFVGNPPTITWVGGATVAGPFSIGASGPTSLTASDVGSKSAPTSWAAPGPDQGRLTGSASLVVLGGGAAGAGYPAPQGSSVAIGQYTVPVYDPMPEDATSADALLDRVFGASARTTYGISLTNVVKAPTTGAPLALYGTGQATLPVPFQGGAPRRIFALLGIYTWLGRTYVAHVTAPEKASTDPGEPPPTTGPNVPPRPPKAWKPPRDIRMRSLKGEDGRGRPPATRREPPERSIAAPGAAPSASAQTKQEQAFVYSPQLKPTKQEQPLEFSSKFKKPLIWFFQDLASGKKPY